MNETLAGSIVERRGRLTLAQRLNGMPWITLYQDKDSGHIVLSTCSRTGQIVDELSTDDVFDRVTWHLEQSGLEQEHLESEIKRAGRALEVGEEAVENALAPYGCMAQYRGMI